MNPGPISKFIKHHYRHFNAAALVEAAEAYVDHLHKGGKMFLSLAGAMSTAELGVSLAEMIRQDKVHAITCTGANLEEDLFIKTTSSVRGKSSATVWLSRPRASIILASGSAWRSLRIA